MSISFWFCLFIMKLCPRNISNCCDTRFGDNLISYIVLDLYCRNACLQFFKKTLLYSFIYYFKIRKENVRISNTRNIFQILISGVPQRSILRPILLNILIDDLILWIPNSELLNFEYDNNICVPENTTEKLIGTLEKEIQTNQIK